MPSTRKKSRLLDHPSTKLATGDCMKKDPITRMKKYKLKSKKAVHSKKLLEEYDEPDDGMFFDIFISVL